MLLHGMDRPSKVSLHEMDRPSNETLIPSSLGPVEIPAKTTRDIWLDLFKQRLVRDVVRSYESMDVGVSPEEDD